MDRPKRRDPRYSPQAPRAGFQTSRTHHTSPVDLLLDRLERVRQTGPGNLAGVLPDESPRAR
jgi:hypothetical protein